MKRILLSIAGLSLVCGLALTGTAEAQGRRIVAVDKAPPLTVTKRSWLDMGNVVPVGTQNSYLSASQSLNSPVYASFAPDRFGQSTLPGRFDLNMPGNPRGPESGGIFFDD